MAGRPTDLTPEVQERICKALRAGNTYKDAAEYGGVDPSTMRNWMARGRKGQEPFAAFLAAVKKAETAAVMKAVKAIRKAGDKNWTAYAWWLERKRPDEWSTLQRELREWKRIATEKRGN
jgi:transposase